MWKDQKITIFEYKTKKPKQKKSHSHRVRNAHLIFAMCMVTIVLIDDDGMSWTNGSYMLKHNVPSKSAPSLSMPKGQYN